MGLYNLPIETMENVCLYLTGDYESYFAFRNCCKYTCQLSQADYFKCALYQEFVSKIQLLCDVHYVDGQFLTYNQLGYTDTFADAYIMFECFQQFPQQIKKRIVTAYGPLLNVLLEHLNICNESKDFFHEIVSSIVTEHEMPCMVENTLLQE